MNVFIVDDHPITAEGYKNALLSGHAPLLQPVFTMAHSCEMAYVEISRAIDSQIGFDIAIIDLNLPVFLERKLYSGKDVAALIKSKMPHCKIIMITAHTEILIIYDIIKEVCPEGLMVKNDITPEKLGIIVQGVFQGKLYQSPLVEKCVKDIWKKELMVDDFNRQILMYLSKGFKVKDLCEVIHLSNSAIQKRIIHMNKAFEVSDNAGLLKAAINEGFI